MILSAREQPTTIGEIDGQPSKRIQEIAEAFSSAGFPVSISPRIDAWLKTHVAEISPTALALFMADCNLRKLADSPEIMTLLIRAIREGFQVLAALGIPITPPSHSIFRWLPEFLLKMAMKRKINNPAMEIKIGHAADSREEMRVIADEFDVLIRQSGIATPSIDALRSYLDPIESTAPAIEQQRSGEPIAG